MTNLAQPCDVNELKDNGVLLEINRAILHPLGYDMSVLDDNGVSRLTITKTDDPDGVHYRFEDIPAEVVGAITSRSIQFQELAKKKHANRKKQCGYVVQPLVDQLVAAQ